MSDWNITQNQASRIAKAVQWVERHMEFGSDQYVRPGEHMGGFFPMRLTDGDLTEDNPAMGKLQVVSDPTNLDAYSLRDFGEELKIYPWKIPTDKKLSEGKNIWCFSFMGRIWGVVPEDCWEDRDEEE